MAGGRAALTPHLPPRLVPVPGSQRLPGRKDRAAALPAAWPRAPSSYSHVRVGVASSRKPSLEPSVWARPGQTPPGGAPGTPGSPRLRRRAGDTEVDTHTDAHGAPSIHCAGRSWPRAALSPEAGPGSALCTGRSDCSHQGALLASSRGALAWLRQAISGFWFSSWELWRLLGGGAMETPGGRGSGNRDLQMCSRLLGLQPRLGGRPSWGL